MKHLTCLFTLAVIMPALCASVISAPQQQSAVPVVVEKVIEMRFKEPITFVGTVESDQRSLVAAEVSGLVQDLLYKEGDFVEKGDVLARLKQDPLQIQIREAKAALKEAEARLEYAESQTIRFKGLYEKAVIPVEDLQKSLSERNAWAEKVIQYQSKIEQWVYDLDQMQIRAPFSGHIVSKHTEIGEWLAKGAGVYELVNLDSNYVLVNAPEHIAVTLKQDDPAEIKFDAFPDLVAAGNIVAIIPQASRKARTLPVKVGFQNNDNMIKSGLLARASFLIGNETPSKLVSKDAIVEMNNQKFIFTAANGVASPVQIETGLAHEDLIEIFGPIEAGMDVIVRGNERVRPGQPVQVIK